MSLNVPKRYLSCVVKHQSRVATMTKLFRQGLNQREIAKQLSVTSRTLRRDLQRLRDDGRYDAFIRDIIA